MENTIVNNPIVCREDVDERARTYNLVIEAIALKFNCGFGKHLHRVYWKVMPAAWELTGVSCASRQPRPVFNKRIQKFHDTCVKVMQWIQRQIKYFSWRYYDWEIPILWEMWGYLNSIKDEKFLSKYDYMFD